MKRVALLVIFAATFAVVANAQRYGGTTCGLIPGPCMERDARQAYAPVDYMLNNYGYNGLGYGYGGYYGYGYGGYGGRLGTSALIGAASGVIAGGLVAAAVSHRSDNRTTYVTASPDGGQYYAEPRQAVFAASKPQKPLDCRKKSNRQTCEAMAREQEATARQEAERQALATSPWRLYNRSGFIIEVFDDNRSLGRMRVNQSWRVMEPASGFRAVILAPDFSGAISEHEARIRPSSDFQGWVITAPKVEE